MGKLDLISSVQERGRTMRMSTGVASLAIAVVLFACGAEDQKAASRAKGTATLTFDGCPYMDAAIYGSGSGPTLNDYGATVQNGNGYDVSCSVGGQGGPLQAHIESDEMSLDVSSSDGTKAAMIFFVAGAGGTPAVVESVDDNNDPAPICTLTTAKTDTLLTVGNGTIFAEYSCGKVWESTNVGVVCQTRGLFYFTNCGG